MDAEHESICFVFVHGTDLLRHLRRAIRPVAKIIPFLDRWCPREAGEWCRDGSPLRKTLKIKFPTAKFEEFCWSGALNQHSRLDAALRLVNILKEEENSCRRIFIIAHSHGGNISLQALKGYTAPCVYLITVFTPFIHVDFKKSESRAWQLLFGSWIILVSVSIIISIINWMLSGFIGFPNFLLYILLAACGLYALMFIGARRFFDRVSARFFVEQRKRYAGICLNPHVPTLVLADKRDEVYRLSRFFREAKARSSRTTSTMSKIMSFFSLTKFGIIGLCCAFIYVLNRNMFGQIYVIDVAVAVIVTLAVAWATVALFIETFISVTIWTNWILGYLPFRITSINPIEAVATVCVTKSNPPVGDARPTLTVRDSRRDPGTGWLTHTDVPRVIGEMSDWIHNQLTNCSP